MALFEHAEKIGLIGESASYKVKKTLKTIKWAYSKNLIQKGDFEGLKDRLEGLLDNCKDVSDIDDLIRSCGTDSAVGMLETLIKQSKDPEKNAGEYPYVYFKKSFENGILKASDIQAYITWLKGPWKQMVNKKKKELTK